MPQFVRIQYLRRRGDAAPVFDSYVMEVVASLDETVKRLQANGFSRENTQHTLTTKKNGSCRRPSCR
jgi:hypothetical protein